MVEQRSDWIRRMQKCLDQMNICEHHAVSDITGTTGMAIIQAIVNGERDPHVLAKLRDPRCRETEEQIAEQLTRNWRLEHLFNLHHTPWADALEKGKTLGEETLASNLVGDRTG